MRPGGMRHGALAAAIAPALRLARGQVPALFGSSSLLSASNCRTMAGLRLAGVSRTRRKLRTYRTGIPLSTCRPPSTATTRSSDAAVQATRQHPRNPVLGLPEALGRWAGPWLPPGTSVQVLSARRGEPRSVRKIRLEISGTPGVAVRRLSVGLEEIRTRFGV
jgi:hypothetical protein